MKTAVALAIAALSAAAPAGAAQRFAVIAGNDEGSQGRARLWFAERDADRMAQALRELGDFSAGNVVLLHGKDADEVRAAIASLDQKILTAKAGGERTLLFFYYSGHADGEALHLSGTTFPLRELQELLGASDIATRVMVVDACRSASR